MEVYINATACISHYNTIADDFFFENTPSVPGADRLFITPPEYKEIIPAAAMRRLSHILKMGISAGLICLKRAGVEKPDAVIVGTGIGCYEDTNKFLVSINDNDERMLTPTSFIQSTHNTIAGQIALLIKSHGYNFTYVQQNLSFEYALLDAMLLLKEGEAETVLVGGVDELVESLCIMFERAGHIKKSKDLQNPIWDNNTSGYAAGEGAAFFTIANTQNSNTLAKIKGVKTIQKISSSEELITHTNSFLKESGLTANDISLVLSGVSGDDKTDGHLKNFTSGLNLPVGYFKHLCGEYFTSSGFALWLATMILKKQNIPAAVMPDSNIPEDPKHILIVNQFQDKQYALMCIAAC